MSRTNAESALAEAMVLTLATHRTASVDYLSQELGVSPAVITHLCRQLVTSGLLLGDERSTGNRVQTWYRLATAASANMANSSMEFVVPVEYVNDLIQKIQDIIAPAIGTAAPDGQFVRIKVIALPVVSTSEEGE